MLSDFDLEGKNKFQKAVYYLRYYGLSYTLKKALRKIGIAVREESEYMAWCRRTDASKKELAEQKNSPVSSMFSFAVVSEEDTDIKDAGWQKQTCGRISYIKAEKDMPVSALTAQSGADFYVFSGKDIRVRPEFLYEISRMACGKTEQRVSRIRKKNKNLPDLLYTDEDNCTGKNRSRPFFKPDASLQMLLNFPYLGRCFAVKRSLLLKLAESEAGVLLCGNDWYDLSLQAFRFAEHICHIPKPLFSNLTEKEGRMRFVHSTKEGNAACIRRYLEAEQIEGKVAESDVPGFYHVECRLKHKPLVSVIIPNKDHIEDLKNCLDSLRKSDYTDYEALIVENNSENKETFDFYKKMEEKDDRIRTVFWEGEFNYSAINNFAAEHARGELFLFLNNDTEFIEPSSLRELVSSALKPGVGACGAMLYYGDRTIQHAGVIIGMGGFAAHALWSLTDRDEKYYPFSLCEREVSGVTGACFMVRRSVFEEVGGMEESFAVALNDVDLGLKIRAAGWKILFNPYAKLYHYESKSRGYEDTMEKQARFQQEIERLQTKWKTEIENGDPFYNPNLTLHRADYSMDI